MPKDHGVREYQIWQDGEDGGQILLIKGDPPARHHIREPKLITSFTAASYHEARVKQHVFMGWSPPTEEDFDYPPKDFLE